MAAQVWVSPVRPMVIEALLSFTKLEAVRLEAYSSLETACCFSALKHLPALTHLDLRLSGSHYALADNLDALHSLAKCLRLVSPSLCTPCRAMAAAGHCRQLRTDVPLPARVARVPRCLQLVNFACHSCALNATIPMHVDACRPAHARVRVQFAVGSLGCVACRRALRWRPLRPRSTRCGPLQG